MWEIVVNIDVFTVTLKPKENYVYASKPGNENNTGNGK